MYLLVGSQWKETLKYLKSGLGCATMRHKFTFFKTPLTLMVALNSNLIYCKLLLVRQAARSGFDYIYTFCVVRNLMLGPSRGERKVWKENWLPVSFIIKGTFSKKFYLKVKNSFEIFTINSAWCYYFVTETLKLLFFLPLTEESIV